MDVIAGAAGATDSIRLPERVRSVQSGNGRFELIISRPERLEPGAFPIASLSRLDAAGARHELWSRVLPVYIGPRFALVGDSGWVLLVDEWLRKKDTPYALQILPLAGEGRVYRLDELVTLSGLSWPVISERARFGPWLSARPGRLDEDRVSLEIGGVKLVLDMASGLLMRHQP